MHYDIYCDESRQDLIVNGNSITEHNRYVCFGGITLPTDKRTDLKDKIKALKDQHSVYGELKWDNVSANKLDFYIDLIDLFFSLDYINFRNVVIDATQIDHDAFNNSDHELGYYKFYYQLLYHWVSTANSYYVFTDYKTNKLNTRLHSLKRILNTACHSDCIDVVQALNSKESLPLQMQNVIMGAVGYKFNLGNAGTSSAKKAIVERIEQHLGRAIQPTPKTSTKFNIFKMVLQGGTR